ncbi:MAG TPA: hypothetical protein GXZ32_01430 [Clostridiales bacterium]|nr:hypothetical protein [Clostridiales bacterium]
MMRLKLDRYLLDKINKCRDVRISVIMYINGKIDNQLKRTIAKLSGQIKYDLPLIDAITVDIPCGSLETIVKLPQVRYIQQDTVVNAQVK